ncbi:MAG: ABC transporter substrate-binding protein [Propionibacteriaceae bacterium]|jgi:peptide/nickel transport system substrate-binding protein|nr:ABC transporter substrate-binding protein [Propionibacteriaceae bacterium]
MRHRTHLSRLAAPVAGLLAAALALTACSSPSDGPTGDPTGAADRVLVVGATSDPDTLFPWKATQFFAVNVAQTLYGTLTEFDAELNVVPGLAESWETSDDGLTVTFKLRSGVKFADGTDCDSADVKHSLEAIQAEATAAVARSSLAAVTGIEAPDASTVVLTLSAPDAALPSSLAVINMAILSSDDTEEALNTQPNGTGPFVLKERQANQSLTLSRNDNYWGAAPPLDGIEFRIIPDETSIVSAMQSGNVQLANFDDPLVALSAEAAGLTVRKTPQLSYHVLQLNATKGVLTDENVRLAMQCAIDRQEVLDTAAQGEGEVTGPITSPAYRSDPAARPCPQRDLAKAAEYLAAAGHSDGVTVPAIVSQGEYATSVNEAENLKAQLAEANINLDIEVLESGAYVERWIDADFEAAVALNGGRPDPDGMYGRYFPSAGNLNQVAGYSSPDLDTLFADGKSESDPAKRAEIYDQISRHLEDHAVWIWLFTSYTYTVTTSDVSGYTPMPNASVQYLRTTSVA